MHAPIRSGNASRTLIGVITVIQATEALTKFPVEYTSRWDLETLALYAEEANATNMNHILGGTQRHNSLKRSQHIEEEMLCCHPFKH